MRVGDLLWRCQAVGACITGERVVDWRVDEREMKSQNINGDRVIDWMKDYVLTITFSRHFQILFRSRGSRTLEYDLLLDNENMMKGGALQGNE